MHRRWLVSRTNPGYLDYLSRAASVSPVIAQILINRGIKTASDVSDFLNPGLTGLSDPFQLPGMKEALARIRVAVEKRERVLVHGDYDADGLTATAILTSTLRTMGLDADYFIPHRMVHGYGFHASAVDLAKRTGAGLIITVDCGINSFGTADYAKRHGIDVIITDHHEPTSATHRIKGAGHGQEFGEEAENEYVLPHAAAVINPKCSPHVSRLAILSGAGIAFKVAHAIALEEDLRFSRDDLLPLLDLAALGTIADVVPLTGENRIILKEAMQFIQNGVRPAIRSLKEVAGLGGPLLKAGLLPFTLVPRINAAGRIDDSGDVVRLLLSDSEEEAAELSSWLDRVNAERQRIEEAVYQEARESIAAGDTDSVVMLSGRGWHQGVLGIVASKIADAYCLPTFVFSIESGIAKGSARSIPSFDICRGLAECEDLLLSFGGHKQAAGVKLKVEDLAAFQDRMRGLIKRDLAGADNVPTIEIDAQVAFPMLNSALLKEIEMLEPFGHGNPEPLLGSRDLDVVGPRLVGNNHLKMKLKQGQASFDAIGFDMGNLIKILDHAARFDAAFTLTLNEWNGGRYLQLVLKAFRPSLP